MHPAVTAKPLPCHESLASLPFTEPEKSTKEGRIQMSLLVDVFRCRSDNYGYLLHDEATGATAALDAPEEEPIRAALKRQGWTLTDILITHHHADHTAGIAGLKASFGAKVTGPLVEATKIEGLDDLVSGGQSFTFGSITMQVFDVPGHTLGHVAYYDAEGGHLFSGDALFSLGCGRMFEGTPGPMWDGLCELRALPDDVLVYCGHEYSAANAQYALSVDPDNPVLIARAQEIKDLRANDKFTIPSRLGDEKMANPFLRADDPAIAARLGLKGADPADVFAALRKGKDNF